MKHSRWKQWGVAAAKWLVVVVVIGFIHHTIADAWQQLSHHPPRLQLGWLVLSGAMYLIGTLLCGVFWYYSLRVLGQPVRFGQALRAYYIGHLGKYVPGKAMVVILRAGLIRGRGVDTSLAAAAVFFETLTMMATGAMLAGAIVAIWFRGEPQLFWASVGLMLVAGLPTSPPVFRRLTRLVGVGRKKPEIVAKLDSLGWLAMLVGWFLTGIGWIFQGFGFWAVLRALGCADPNPWMQLPLCAAAVTLATVAGFLSFVPGGAVVREAVLAELMIPHLGGGVSLISAVLLRMVGLVAELAISGILYLGVRGPKSSAENRRNEG
ncbi:MAG: lysylphosphatidylglycerol synthase transmembrane domain-containing protein [Thermoguttaceae bacterium]